MSAAVEDILPDVFRLLRERAGIEPASFGAPGIAQAVRNRLTASQAESPRMYLHQCGSDAAEFQKLLEELVVPETWFFREKQAFRSLARHLEQFRSSQRVAVRILSGACSTGEEVYSIAIVCREAGFSALEYSILGTDVSQKSLEAARTGTFPSRSFRDPDETICRLRQCWCRPVGDSWRVCDELRSGVEFRNGNLAQSEFLRGESPFHVVFCRNVLIYFHAEARRLAVRHLHRLLRPDGLLFSSSAEARIFSDAGFSVLDGECPFAFRRPEKLAEDREADAVRPAPPAPPAPVVAARPAPHFESRPPRAASASQPAVTASAAHEAESGPALLARARHAADNGQLDEADRLCDRALALDAASAEAHYLRGLVRQAQKSWIEAQRSFEKAVYLQPRHYEALVHLMLLAQQRGDHQTAANYRRRAERAALGEAE